MGSYRRGGRVEGCVIVRGAAVDDYCVTRCGQ
jgi:hypothetical protein